VYRLSSRPCGGSREDGQGVGGRFHGHRMTTQMVPVRPIC
jgi:hypothetical protein